MKMKALTLFLLSAVVGSTYGCGIFNGVTYHDGDVIPGICFNLMCRFNGTDMVWVIEGHLINKECAKCCVHNDPHFHTFDKYRYHWHETCNYTISQRREKSPTWGYDARYGIYSDFKKCSPGSTASCVDRTTYKADANTAVDIIHSLVPDGLIYINDDDDSYHVAGNPETIPTYSLIAWKTSSWIFLQGLDFSMMVSHAGLYIWTTPDHLELLAGLCGYYTNNVTEDFTGRDELVYNLETLPYIFPDTWLTAEQMDKCCVAINVSEGQNPIPMSKKPVPCVPTTEDYKTCAEILVNYRKTVDADAYKALLENSAQDMCLDPKNKEKWLANAVHLADTESLVVKLTEREPTNTEQRSRIE